MSRRVQNNLVTTDTSLKQDIGSAMAKIAAVTLAYSSIVGLLPILGVWTFVPVLAFIGIFLGLYLRWAA